MRFLLFLLLAGAVSVATAGELRDLRLWDSPEGTRVVLELDGSTAHKVFTLENPSRIVVDRSSKLRASGLEIAHHRRTTHLRGAG